MYKEIIVKAISKAMKIEHISTFEPLEDLLAHIFIFNEELREHIASMDKDNSIFNKVEEAIKKFNNSLNINWDINQYEKCTIKEITQLLLDSKDQYFRDLIEREKVDISKNKFEILNYFSALSNMNNKILNPYDLIDNYLTTEDQKKLIVIITTLYNVIWTSLLRETNNFHELTVIMNIDLLIIKILNELNKNPNINEVLNEISTNHEILSGIIKTLKLNRYV